jgi:hypothetical protein
MHSIETLLTDWRYDRRNRHDSVTIPLIWVAFVLSLLVHIAALWIMLPKLLHDLSEVDAKAGKSGGALAVQLEPKPSTPSPPSTASPPPVLARAAPPRTPPKPLQKPRPTPPPVLAMPKPDAEATLPKPTPPEEPPAPTVAPKPIEGDLASYVEARRRARGESAASPSNAGKNEAGESDLERRNRIVATNLGLNATPTFGYDPKSAGGIFQIEHLSYEYADFYFFGLNRDVGRNTKQLIEVKRGAESDIRVALIRKMITIIRDNISGDFVWLSRRGPVTMSARLNDNAELEAFIMRDVFPDERLPR